jgi:hypothetical protein
MTATLCAYVMIKANYKPPASELPSSEMAHTLNFCTRHVLLKELIRVRQDCGHCENPTYITVLTSWFHSGCYFGLAIKNIAWTYLRDATTQAQLLRMHYEETYKNNFLNASRKRVLYWLLFIAERCVQDFICAPRLLGALTNFSQDLCFAQALSNLIVCDNTFAFLRCRVL